MRILLGRSSKENSLKITKDVDSGQARTKTHCLIRLLWDSAEISGRNTRISWFSQKYGVPSMTPIRVRYPWFNLDQFHVHSSCQSHYHRYSVKVLEKMAQSLQLRENPFQLSRNGMRHKDRSSLQVHSLFNRLHIIHGHTLLSSTRKAHGQQSISSSFWTIFQWHSLVNLVCDLFYFTYLPKNILLYDIL